jgi:hypothetical protein
MLSSKHHILRWFRAPNRVLCVGAALHESSRDFLGEEDLAGVRGMPSLVRLVAGGPAQPHLEMNVIGAAHVDARENCLKMNRTILRGRLDAPQERRFICGTRRWWGPKIPWRTVLKAWRGSLRRRTAGTGMVFFRKPRIDSACVAVP